MLDARDGQLDQRHGERSQRLAHDESCGYRNNRRRNEAVSLPPFEPDGGEIDLFGEMPEQARRVVRRGADDLHRALDALGKGVDIIQRLFDVHSIVPLEEWTDHLRKQTR